MFQACTFQGGNSTKNQSVNQFCRKNIYIVDLVANRGNFNRNYWGRTRIPGSYRLGGTDVTWDLADVLEDTPLESNP